VHRLSARTFGVVATCLFASAPAYAQPDTASGGGERFVRDVLGDYTRFLSRETLLWLRVGGSAALAVHVADEPLSADIPSADLKGAQEYGGLIVQVPLALAWWGVGHLNGGRHGAAGRDLVRAQISAASWTYALKFAANRTRPNGEPRSFPSGHASSTFATAAVLQQHYGWKVGVAGFSVATYTAASRVSAEKHWASDVLLGCFLGIASGRAVTMRLRDTRLSIAPMVTGDRIGVAINVLD